MQNNGRTAYCDNRESRSIIIVIIAPWEKRYGEDDWLTDAAVAFFVGAQQMLGV